MQNMGKIKCVNCGNRITDKDIIAVGVDGAMCCEEVEKIEDKIFKESKDVTEFAIRLMSAGITESLSAGIIMHAWLSDE